jgi:outer membrane protein assembly factor BamB
MINRRAFNLSACGGLSGLIAAAFPGAAQGGSWLGWRGNGRDGFVGDSVWPNSLSAKNLTLLWQHPLDNGYSGPIVSGQRVFVTETRSASEEVVTAFDLDSGQAQWTARWPGSLSVPFFAKSNGDWIRSTPACDGQTLYVGGMRDVLVALDCDSGKEAWRLDFPGQLGTELPSFGFVCSPLVVGDRLYVQAGGGFAAVDKSSGRVIWKVLDDGGGMWGSAFSSPVMVELHGRQQLLVQTRTHLVGIEPEDGKKLWEVTVEAFRGMNILTPSVWNDCVFTSSYGGKSLLLEFDPSSSTLWSVKTRWENKSQAYMSSPVIIGSSLYLHLRNRRVVCLDLETGNENWTTKPFGQYWSMLTNGKQILALDQRGSLLLIEHNPSQFQLLDERELTQEESWAHLALAGEFLLVRHQKGISVFRWSV